VETICARVLGNALAKLPEEGRLGEKGGLVRNKLSPSNPEGSTRSEGRGSGKSRGGKCVVINTDLLQSKNL